MVVYYCRKGKSECVTVEREEAVTELKRDHKTSRGRMRELRIKKEMKIRGLVGKNGGIFNSSLKNFSTLGAVAGEENKRTRGGRLSAL